MYLLMYKLVVSEYQFLRVLTREFRLRSLADNLRQLNFNRHCFQITEKHVCAAYHIKLTNKHWSKQNQI